MDGANQWENYQAQFGIKNLQRKIDRYPNVEGFMRTNNIGDSLYLKEFQSHGDAINHYSLLMAHRHHHIGVPYPIFMVEGFQGCHSFFVPILRQGPSLATLLKDNRYKSWFYDYIKYCNLGIKPPSRRCDSVPLRISTGYQNIISGLITAIAHLLNTPLKCSLSLDNVFITDTENPSVTVTELHTSETNMWESLANLITLINTATGELIDHPEEELQELLERLRTAQGQDMSAILSIPLFWKPAARISFIFQFWDFLEDNMARIWDQSISDAFGTIDWETTINQYKTLQSVMSQDARDRTSKSLVPRRKGQNDAMKMVYCFSFVRHTLVHFIKYRTAITSTDKQYPIKDDKDLYAVYEFAFPKHLRLLVGRAKQLGFNFEITD